MSRVLLPTESCWYDELKAVGYYGETDLERMILQHVQSLFPSFYVFPFKRKVTSRVDGITKAPDLAMLRRDRMAWGIIEVELGEHNIQHVLDQTRVFSEGDYYAPEVANYVRAQLKKFCGVNVGSDRLKRLFENELPTVLVIVDSINEKWSDQLTKVGVSLCVFETFKSVRGGYLFRTHGDYPIIPEQEAHCRRTALPNTYEVVGHFEFRGGKNARNVDIAFQHRLTRWVLIRDAGRTYLRFVGKANPLSPSDTYRLYSDGDKKYYLEKN